MFAKAKAAAAAAAKSAAAASNAAATSAAKAAAAAKAQANKMSSGALGGNGNLHPDSHRADALPPPPSYDVAVATPGHAPAPGGIELDDLLAGGTPSAAPISPTSSGVFDDSMRETALVPVPEQAPGDTPRERELAAQVANLQEEKAAFERWRASTREAQSAVAAEAAAADRRAAAANAEAEATRAQLADAVQAARPLLANLGWPSWRTLRRPHVHNLHRRLP